MRCLLLFLLSCLVATGTSFTPVDEVCPVCEKKSIQMRLASYSNWGPVDRDVLRHPPFVFRSQTVCPHDVYVGSQGQWRDGFNEDEKKKLKTFLEKPVITLSAKERAAFEGKKALLVGGLKEILLARECARQLDLTDGASLHFAISLYTSGGTQLRDFFRKELLAALARELEADWMTPQQKITFSYLYADKLREDGKEELAVKKFNEFLKKDFGGHKEDTDTLKEWARARLLEVSLQKVTGEDLLKMLDKRLITGGFEMRLKSRLVIDEIFQRMLHGDDKMTSLFLNFVGKDKELLATLKKASAHSWGRKGIPALNSLIFPKKGMLGDGIQKHKMAMHFEKWRKAKSMPLYPSDVSFDVALDFYGDGLSYSNSVAQDAYFKDQCEGFILLLPYVTDSKKKWDYGVSYGVRGLIEHKGELKEELEAVLKKEWNSLFWKMCVQHIYEGGQLDALISHPNLKWKFDYRYEYEVFMWRFLKELKEDVWVDKGIEELSTVKWVDGGVLRYLVDFDSPKLEQALETRLLRERNKLQGKGELSGSEYRVQVVEEALATLRLQRVPVQ